MNLFNINLLSLYMTRILILFHSIYGHIFEMAKAAYNGTLERIILQKYFALFFTDFQQWFEYRRTGFPLMPKAAGMLNNQVMPVRYRYPPAVQSTNTTNYDLAVQAMGGDNINIKVWWEK